MEPSDFPSHSPYKSSGRPVVEFTVRAVVLGIILSALMGAANVYLGLKAGMTVSASIPAAVISMGILRGVMRKGTILENNIVQTIASAGESLAAGIIFTIPGLILTGVWSHFHYWTVSLVALLGGILGVMFMIPLRRTLIVDEVELKYPEGVACAEVLEAGERGGKSILYILSALGVGALMTWLIKGMALFKASVEFGIRAGKAAVGFGLDISSALIGVGYIVGFNIALLVFIGGAIAWFVAIPVAAPAEWPWGEEQSLQIDGAGFVSLDDGKVFPLPEDGKGRAIPADLWVEPGKPEITGLNATFRSMIHYGRDTKIAPIKGKTFEEAGPAPEDAAWGAGMEKEQVAPESAFYAVSSSGKTYKVRVDAHKGRSIGLTFAGESAAIDVAFGIWTTQIRFMGVGAMVIGGLWSIFKMRRGVLKGIRDAFRGYGKTAVAESTEPRTETDMHMRSIIVIAIAMTVGIFILYSMVTRNRTITAKSGVSVVVLERDRIEAAEEAQKAEGGAKKSMHPAYGLVPLSSGEEEWKVQGTIYETVEDAYVLDAGTAEKEFEFAIPLKAGMTVSPPDSLKKGQEVTFTSAAESGNQVVTGTVTAVDAKSVKVKAGLRLIRKIPRHRVKTVSEPDADGRVSIVTTDKEMLTGKLVEEWSGATHLLTNDGHRYVFTTQQVVNQATNYRFDISVIALVAMIVAGFFFVAVASYIAGLVGSSNNPVSGMIICTVLFTSGLLLLFGFSGNLGIIAALGVAGVVCCAAATAGDVSQDLKTGWLVKATPAKQQYGQVIGVAASAFLIAPVLGMLHNAYTIGSKELAAPQAGMFASIVDKIFRHKPFPWGMALAGVCVAIVLIIVDEILRSRKSSFRTYVMPVAVGIYLPILLAVPILIGGLLSLIVGRVSGKDAQSKTAAIHRGVLFCAGLIAGEAVMGIIIGGLKVTADLPIGIWGRGTDLLASMLSILAIAVVIVLVFVVSLAGKEAKQS